jgi:hypothetical protein
MSEHKNGIATNGYEKKSSPASSSTKSEAKPLPNGDKKDGIVKSFKQLRVASKRPLPKEMGDGSYRVVANRPGLREDVRRLRGKGTRSLSSFVM